MITLLYILLIYVLLGSLVYLIAIQQCNTELTPFKTELFLLLGFIFRPILSTINTIDERRINKRQEKYIEFVKNNDNLTEDEKEAIIKYITEIQEID